MTDTQDDMLSPDASPSGLGKHSGVRRVNNLPLYLIGGGLAAFVLLIMTVMLERSHKEQTSAQAAPETHGDAMQLANSITGSQIDGMIPPATPKQTLTVPIALPDNLEKPPLPERLKETASSDPDMQRINQEKMQLFEQAVTDKTTVPFAAPEAHGDNSGGDRRAQTLQRIEDARQRIAALQQDDPNAAFKARLAQLEGGGSATALNQPGDLKPFDSNEQKDRWQLGAQVEAPETPYTLRAGFVIPATLISGINSDLPGQIIGQVSQNVYDTATGKYLLLPQGSRLVGSYTSNVAYGQSRVLIAWQRIVFPDGKTLDIGAMPGADSAGYAGFSDQVNNHYLRLFGSAILMSGITAGVALSQNTNNNGGIYAQPTASSAMSEALGQQLGTVTAQMISKNLNISPTLEIRPGFRFNVMCVKDLVLTRPYMAFDY